MFHERPATGIHAPRTLCTGARSSPRPDGHGSCQAHGCGTPCPVELPERQGGPVTGNGHSTGAHVRSEPRCTPRSANEIRRARDTGRPPCDHRCDVRAIGAHDQGTRDRRLGRSDRVATGTRGTRQTTGQLHRSRSFQGGLSRLRPRGASRVGRRGDCIDADALDTGGWVRLGAELQRTPEGQGGRRFRAPHEIHSAAREEGVHVRVRDAAGLAGQGRMGKRESEARCLEGHQGLRRFRSGAVDRAVGPGPDLDRRTAGSTGCRLSIAGRVLDGVGVGRRARLVTATLRACSRTPLRAIPRVARGLTGPAVHHRGGFERRGHRLPGVPHWSGGRPRRGR